MRKRVGWTLFVLLVCAVAAIPAVAGGAAPQMTAAAEKPAVFTYVAEWTVPRAMWNDFDKQEAASYDTLKKAVADGTLLAYGVYAVVNHQEGLPTHGTWFSASSMANLMKVLEGLRAAPAATSPVLAASKHWDYILTSRDYNYHSGTFTNGYLRVATWMGKAGANDPGGKILKASMVALLEKMFADGALHGYQIDEEVVHSADPNAFFVALVTNGAEGLDKFSAAIEEMGKNNPTALAAFQSLIDEHGHRDMLARVSTFSHK